MVYTHKEQCDERHEHIADIIKEHANYISTHERLLQRALGALITLNSAMFIFFLGYILRG